jgi:hypothetical protein
MNDTKQTPNDLTLKQAKLASKNPRYNRTSYNVSTRAGKAGWQIKFLASLRKIPNVTVACVAARVTSPTVYKRRELDPKFAEAWEEAINAGVEKLEEEAWRRAKDGVVRNVWMKDENGVPVKVDKERVYSDTLAIFLLKAHKPQKYRDNVRTELTGPDGAPLTTVVAPQVSVMILDNGRDAAAGTLKDDPPALVGQASSANETMPARR